MKDDIKDAHEHLKAGIEKLKAAGVQVPIELHKAAQILHHALMKP